MSRRGLGLALASGVALLAVLVPARAASAHPLDVYLQSAYVTVGSGEIGVELDLSPGVLIAPGVLPLLDADHNRSVSAAESRRYAYQVVDRVVVTVDGSALRPRIDSIETPSYPTLQAGYGTIRVFTTAGAAPTSIGTHHVLLRNEFTPRGAAYQANAFVAKGAAITLGTQHRSANEQQTVIDYRIHAGTGAAAPSRAEHAAAQPTSTRAGGLFDLVQRPALSLWIMLLALALAVLLGGLHALTPGHGKTLMAAYLVGTGGTTRNAITLGAVVTFTHTASVVAIGFVALLAGQFIVPGVLVPTLEIVAGALVVLCGARLIRQRRRALNAVPVHASTHLHDRDHEHGGVLVHDHGDGKPHAHPVPAERVTVRSLVALGISGGLVPCPEALGVMILAIGVNRIALGMSLIVAFSVGLAAVLIGLGLVLVHARSRLERWTPGRDSRFGQALPMVSAVVVTLLGVALVVRGLGGHLPLLT